MRPKVTASVFPSIIHTDMAPDTLLVVVVGHVASISYVMCDKKTNCRCFWGVSGTNCFLCWWFPCRNMQTGSSNWNWYISLRHTHGCGILAFSCRKMKMYGHGCHLLKYIYDIDWLITLPACSHDLLTFCMTQKQWIRESRCMIYLVVGSMCCTTQ